MVQGVAKLRDTAAAARNALPLRTRLLLGSAVVQLVMMALLIYSSISVMDDKLIERTRVHLEEQKHLLSAALAAPLAQSDRSKVNEVLERARREQGIEYLVLFDHTGAHGRSERLGSPHAAASKVFLRDLAPPGGPR